MAEPAREADSRLSTAIAIARLIGIMGIVYVHAWTGRTAEELAAVAFSWQAVLRTVLGEVFGRSAVPLLGMISGWLVVSTATSQGYAAFVLGKARTILLPMVLWNAIAIVLVGAAATFGDLKAPTPTSIGWTLNELVPLVQANDVNVQMPFLRDLFVCMVIAPGLVRASNAWLALVASIVVVWSVSGVHVPPLLRPQILLFFTAGVAVRRFGLVERAAGWPIALCGLPFVVLIAPRLWTALLGNAFFDAYPHLMAAFDIVFRLASAVLFWRLAWGLAGSNVADRLRGIERYGFLAFCDHLVLLWLFGPVIGLATGALGAGLYPVYLLVQPPLVLGVTVVLGRVLMALSPSIARVLSGGRLGRSALVTA
ncbi:acyltransferase [Sphingomonas sp. PAMC26645]|uniref:acyltransferase family protein n=1 Tax=Sphingomonas sp. PAMC26645 TaxID=2565555 RepID=UPI00109DD537|nr:acyltransferase [Sphingomonas sp. PAMC26645]QCB41202.1 acyltransferase [Sphingomonas sp. PAMC26645]